MPQRNNDQPSPLGRLPLFGAFFITLVILLLGAELAQTRFWGFAFFAYYPAIARILTLSLALALGAAGYLLLPHFLPKLEQTQNKRFLTFALVSSIVLAMSFFAFRAQTYFFGDGYALIDILSAPETVIKARNWAGTILAYLFMLASGERSAASATNAYMWASILAGLAFLAITAFLTLHIYKDGVRRIALFLGLVLGGYALQFFGYAENYPWFLVAVLLFTLVGWRVLEGQLSAYWLLLLAALGMAFHTFGVALVIPALFALLARSKSSKKLAKSWKKYKVALITAIMALGLVGLFVAINSSLYIRYAIVEPLDSPLAAEGYTMFSLAHLLDMLSLLFVLVPGIFVIGVAAWMLRKETAFNPTLIFLFLQTLASWGIVFLMEAELGVPRDWDLFAFAGIPTVALFAHLLLGGTQQMSYRSTAWWLAMVLAVMVLGARVGVIASPERAVTVFSDYMKLDVSKSAGVAIAFQEYYYRIDDTARLTQARKYWHDTYPYFDWMTTGARLLEQGQAEQARELFQKTLEVNPGMNRAWLGMGMYFISINQLDSAQSYLDMAYGLNPLNSSTASELAHVAYLRHDYATAEKFLEEAASLSWDSDLPLYNLAQARLSRGNRQGYFEAMEKAVRRVKVDPITAKELADAYRQDGNMAKANQYYRMADSLARSSNK